MARALKRSNVPRPRSGSRNLVTFEASLRDPQKGRSELASECLEKALHLSDNMQELKGLRKRVRLNLFNHVMALFHAKFACNLAIRYPVFRWELCKGCV